MANLAINNGGVSTNKGGLPSIDLRYGPWASVADAYAHLGPDGDDVITPGLTVGILSGSTVTEYWFNGGVDQAHLVPKQTAQSTNWSDITGKPTDLVQDAQYVHTDNNYSDEDKAKLSKVDKKQDTLVSGTNIKSVNGQSLLGAGNLEVTGKSAYEVYVENLPTDETRLSEAEWLESLKGETGSAGHNPCLGRYNMFPDPAPEAVAGDYLFVDDTTESPVVTYVYKYDGTAWDSGAVVVTSETGTDTGTETQIVTEEVNLTSGLKVGQLSKSNGVYVYKNWSNINHLMVPAVGYSKAIFTSKPEGSDGFVFAFLASDTLVVDKAPTYAPGETTVRWFQADGADHEVEIPKGTTHIYVGMSGEGDGSHRYQPARMQLVKEVTTTTVKNEKKTMNVVLRRMFFEQGRYASKDSYTEDPTVVTSGIVQGGRGFALELKTGYVVRAVHMTDLKGNVVKLNYWPPDTTLVWGSGSGKSYYSSMNVPPKYGVVIEVKREDGGTVGYDDALVEMFEYLDDAKLTRDTSNPAYEKVQYRLRQMCHLVYTPLRDIPFTVPTSWAPNQEGKFQLAGELMVGPPYSDVGICQKYIGQHVSFYTFLTAVHNPLSLLYTEKVGSKSSHYGIDYTGTTDSSITQTYFGSVCSSFAQYLSGMKHIATVAWLGKKNGMTEVTIDFDTVQLFDFLCLSGHVYMATDIISEGGQRKYVVLSEMSRPTSISVAYTRDTFTAHRMSGVVHVWRWNGWENVPAAEATPFINQGMDDYEDAIDYNEDICTFAGDKATFGVGDKIYLNIRRDGKYTSVKLSNEDGSFVETIPISELAADTSLTPNSRDWVSLNLTTYNLAAGLYNACALDADGNASGYTYFEVLDVQLSVEGSGNNYTANFSSSNGQCYLVEGENTGGFPGNYYIDGLEDGSVAVTLTSSTRYIRVFVRGQYGVATKRVYVDA